MFSGGFFYLEHNRYCSTFMMDIESSLIHSMNIFIWLQANIYWYKPLKWVIQMCLNICVCGSFLGLTEGLLIWCLSIRLCFILIDDVVLVSCWPLDCVFIFHICYSRYFDTFGIALIEYILVIRQLSLSWECAHASPCFVQVGSTL